MKARRRTVLRLIVVGCVIGGFPQPARAVDLNAGVSVGGMVSTGAPRLTISPHFGISWRTERGLLLSLHDLFSILPPLGGSGFGVYNQVSGSIGYAWNNMNVSAGPSCSMYFMPVCRSGWCGRVAGISPGMHLDTSVYFAGSLGMWGRVNFDWLSGRSLVLPGGPAAMVVAGPLIRW